MDFNVFPVIVNGVVPVIPPLVALTLVEPSVKALTTPEAVVPATAGVLDAHVAEALMFCVVPSE